MINTIKKNVLGVFAIIIAITLIAASAICCTVVLNTKHVDSLERSIKLSIEKGIDPIAARCAYADKNDTICTIYAAKK